MRAFHRRKPESVGQSPGLLVYVGQDRDFHPTLTSNSFTSGEVTETCCELPGAPPPPDDDGRVHLFNVMGVHAPEFIRRVG